MGRSSPFVSLAEEQRRRAEAPAEGPAIPFLVLTGFVYQGGTFPSPLARQSRVSLPPPRVSRASTERGDGP